jgi:hypothetical protein
MTAQRLVIGIITLSGGAIGLLAPIGVVKWLLQTDPEEAGILTLFFFPVWCLLVVLGLLIGRKGRTARDRRRQAGRAEKSLSQIPSSQIATMVPSVARPLMVHPVA